jgi:hypothetical protein
MMGHIYAIKLLAAKGHPLVYETFMGMLLSRVRYFDLINQNEIQLTAEEEDRVILTSYEELDKYSIQNLENTIKGLVGKTITAIKLEDIQELFTSTHARFKNNNIPNYHLQEFKKALCEEINTKKSLKDEEKNQLLQSIEDKMKQFESQNNFETQSFTLESISFSLWLASTVDLQYLFNRF